MLLVTMYSGTIEYPGGEPLTYKSDWEKEHMLSEKTGLWENAKLVFMRQLYARSDEDAREWGDMNHISEISSSSL